MLLVCPFHHEEAVRTTLVEGESMGATELFVGGALS